MKQIQDSPSPEVAVGGKALDVEAEVLSPPFVGKDGVFFFLNFTLVGVG